MPGSTQTDKEKPGQLHLLQPEDKFPRIGARGGALTVLSSKYNGPIS